MKKILIGLLCLSTSVIASESTSSSSLTVRYKPFNGFYAGVFAGYTNRAVKTSSNITGTPVPGVTSTINYSHTKRIPGFLYGLMIGFGQNLNGCYLGGEATFHYDTANKYKLHTTNADVRGGGVRGSTPVSFKTNYKRSPVIGLGIRIGTILSREYLLFAKLGIEMSRDRGKAKDLNVAGVSASSGVETGARKTKLTFVPGVGIEKFLYNNLIGRIEYNYTFGNKVSVDDVRMRYTAHTIKAGLSYQF